jgi:uncharacterized protein (TIGR02466 family)
MSIRSVFPTSLFHEPLRGGNARLNRELLSECRKIRETDRAGRTWSATNYRGGYTSYSSYSELHQMSSTFMQLRELIDRQVQRFARSLDMDLQSHKLAMTQCWVNIMPSQCFHGLHLHPLSAISGTYYVQVPRGPKGGGGGELKFEDPRLACFMGSVPRVEDARLANRRFVSIQPKVGELVLFESWLRHEVTPHGNDGERVSLSFNYNWF